MATYYTNSGHEVIEISHKSPTLQTPQNKTSQPRPVIGNLVI